MEVEQHEKYRMCEREREQTHTKIHSQNERMSEGKKQIIQFFFKICKYTFN